MRKAQSSMEYIMMIAGILVIVVLIAFVVMSLLNKQLPVDQAAQEKMNSYILSPNEVGCAKYTNAKVYQASSYSQETQCLCFDLVERCTLAGFAVAPTTPGTPGSSPCIDPGAALCPS